MHHGRLQQHQQQYSRPAPSTVVVYEDPSSSRGGLHYPRYHYDDQTAPFPGEQEDLWLDHLLQKQGIPVHQQRLIFGVDGPIALDPITGERSANAPLSSYSSSSSTSPPPFANGDARQHHHQHHHQHQTAPVSTLLLPPQQQQQQEGEGTAPSLTPAQPLSPPRTLQNHQTGWQAQGEDGVSGRKRKRQRVEDQDSSSSSTLQQQHHQEHRQEEDTWHKLGPAMPSSGMLTMVQQDDEDEEGVGHSLPLDDRSLLQQQQQQHTLATAEDTASSSGNVSSGLPDDIPGLQRQFAQADVAGQTGILRRIMHEQSRQSSEIEVLKDMVSSLTEQLSKMMQ